MIELSWAHDVFIDCMSHVHVFFMHTYLSFLSFWYWYCLVLFYLSLSFSFFRLVCAWHPSASLPRPKTLFILGHRLLLILLLLMLGFVMIKPIRTFRRTFLDTAFIQNAKSSFRIFPILTYPLSFKVGVGSPFMTSRSAIPPWLYKSFTPICTDLITSNLISWLTFEVRVL